MKLHKPTCIKCINERYPNTDEQWNQKEHDDHNWHIEGKVKCGMKIPIKYPIDGNREFFPITTIPIHCPYTLEHLTQL